MPTFSREWYPFLAGIIVGFIFFTFHVLVIDAPQRFPVSHMVIVPEGLTLDQSAALLKDNNVISSKIFFILVTNFLSKNKVVAGAYFFEKKLSVFGIAERTTTGDYNIAMLRLTFTEGETLKDMAEQCESIIVSCKADEFLKLSKGKEGYVFPDTYFFLPTAKAGDVLKIAENTFTMKVASATPQIQKFGKPLSDVVIMASILEKEASAMKDRQIIAGILWKRISLGMPLQVDAPFDYALGKNTFELTSADLKKDSPYNTYTNKGLPPTPINNPGLEAIIAAVTPIETPYLYYLSDRSGNFHFAKTFPEHVKNKQKYLN